MMITACMVFSGINAPSYAMTKESTIKILENKGDTYTLENYVTSLKEAEQIQKKFFEDVHEDDVENYTITFNSQNNWENSIKCGSFIDTIDGPESECYNEAMHFRFYSYSNSQSIISANGNIYTQITFNLEALKERFK